MNEINNKLSIDTMKHTIKSFNKYSRHDKYDSEKKIFTWLYFGSFMNSIVEFL